MRINKGLGTGVVLSLSRRSGAVIHKNGRERALEVLALIGWVWIVWYLFTQQATLMP